jgi:hypothetical protein
MTIDADPGEKGVGSAPAPSRRSVRRIVAAVVLSVVVMVGLAAWVLLVPYESSAIGEGGREDCDAVLDWIDSPEAARQRAEFEKSCDEAEEERRNVALIAGGVAVTVAFAASTWPSRRLTGEALGPLR